MTKPLQLNRWQTALAMLLGAVAGDLLLSATTAWVWVLNDRIGWTPSLEVRWHDLDMCWSTWLNILWADNWYYPQYSLPVLLAGIVLGAQGIWTWLQLPTAPSRTSSQCIASSWMLVVTLAAWRVYFFLMMWPSHLGRFGYAKWGVHWLMTWAYIVLDPSLLCALAMLWWGYGLRRRSREA